MIDKSHSVDDKKDKQAEAMTQKNTELLEQKDQTVARFEELKVLIAKDDVWREEKTLAENRTAEEEAEKLKEKE